MTAALVCLSGVTIRILSIIPLYLKEQTSYLKEKTSYLKEQTSTFFVNNQQNDRTLDLGSSGKPIAGRQHSLSAQNRKIFYLATHI